MLDSKGPPSTNVIERIMRKLLIVLALTFIPVAVSAQVPNHSNVPRELFASGQFNLTTPEGTGVFTDTVICTLNQIDSNWGNLRKNPGQTQIHGHAEDAALYRNLNGLSTAVDFIGGSGGPNPQPGWIVDAPRYTIDFWNPPHNCGTVPAPGPNPGPTPSPQVPPTQVDLAPLVERLDRLERALAELSLQSASLGSTIRQIADRQEVNIAVSDRIIRQLLEPVVYKGGVFGVPITLRPTINPVTP